MWTVPLPACSADTAYEACISKVKNTDLKGRLNGARSEIGRADTSYRKAGRERDFSGLLAEHCGLTGVTAEEMVWVYDRRMVSRSSPGRAIYDAIMVGSPNGICPLCGQGIVKTLDHYLPKSRYAALAVNPANLIPACSDCNKAKSDAVADTLHPYYDNIEHEPWLRAEHKETGAASVRFFVDPPASWTPEFSGRVTRHFRVFGLNKLYVSNAAQHISGMQLRLSQLATSGAEAVQTHLANEAESWCAVHLNSWQAALLNCLARSDWF